MTQTTRSLIVIPTYNEAENLEPLIAAITALDKGFEILVVDDNSPDGTGQIADRLSRERPGIHVLHRAGKMGLGTAYVEGFKWAIARGYDYIFEMDCDFSHDPHYLPTFLTEIERADLVIGSRYIKGGGTPNWGLLRRLISWGGNTFARLMLGLKAHDCTGGYRCYRRGMLERVPWHEIRLQGYGFQVGAVYYVERLGGRVAEFPIIFEDRRVGQSKMSFKIVLEALAYVTRMALSGKRMSKAVTAESPGPQ
ncbi:MAG: polyprenol monophosphomannose synthase [Chloroflexota bacterium]